MRHIWVRSLWIAALLGALGTSPASASCIAPVLADQIVRADVIAYGSVASAAQLLSFPPRSVLRFRIERLYKGEASGEVQVAAGPSEGAATSVDYHAEDGTKHTLYLRRVGASFATDECSGSHGGPPSAAETKVLGEGRAVAPVAATDWGLATAGVAALSLVVALGVFVWRRRSIRLPR